MIWSPYPRDLPMPDAHPPFSGEIALKPRGTSKPARRAEISGRASRTFASQRNEPVVDSGDDTFDKRVSRLDGSPKGPTVCKIQRTPLKTSRRGAPDPPPSLRRTGSGISRVQSAQQNQALPPWTTITRQPKFVPESVANTRFHRTDATPEKEWVALPETVIARELPLESRHVRGNSQSERDLIDTDRKSGRGRHFPDNRSRQP